MDEKLEQLWEQHNKKVITMIGKLSVPAMALGHPLVREVHSELIAFAAWFDDEMEKVDDTN